MSKLLGRRTFLRGSLLGDGSRAAPCCTLSPMSHRYVRCRCASRSHRSRTLRNRQRHVEERNAKVWRTRHREFCRALVDGCSTLQFWRLNRETGASRGLLSPRKGTAIGGLTDGEKDERHRSFLGADQSVRRWPLQSRVPLRVGVLGGVGEWRAADLTIGCQRRTAGSKTGGSGIRTHDTVARIHAFQACAFSHSAIPPQGVANIGAEASRASGLSLGTCGIAPAAPPCCRPDG